MGKITHDELSDVLNQELQDNVNKIGVLSTLTTTDKTNLVHSINEVNTQLADKQTQIDTLNTNKADKTALDTTNATVASNYSTLDTKINSQVSGSPKGVYATLTDLTTAFPTGNTNIYLTTDNGNWNYWNGSAWVSGGTYQSTGIANKSISYNMVKNITPDEIKNNYIADCTQTISENPASYVLSDLGYDYFKFTKPETQFNAGVYTKPIDLTGINLDSFYVEFEYTSIANAYLYLKQPSTWLANLTPTATYTKKSFTVTKATMGSYVSAFSLFFISQLANTISIRNLKVKNANYSDTLLEQIDEIKENLNINSSNINNKITDIKNTNELFPLINSVYCIGDSLTQGDMGADVGTNVTAKNYPYFLSRLTDWNVANKGHSGYTSSMYWANFDWAETFADYDAVIICLGTNGGLTDTVVVDTADGTFANTYTGDYCHIISYIKNKNPNIKIFLTTIYGGGGTNGVATTNSVINQIATKYGCYLLDINISDIMHTGETLYHPHDGLHFSPVGYLNLAKHYKQLICNVISQNLGDFN